MPEIIKVVGRDYKDSFECAVKLIEAGLAPLGSGELSVEMGGRAIRSGNTLFEYAEGNEGEANSDADTVGFELTEEGGEWFRSVRELGGERASSKSGMQKWVDFISELSRSYHSGFFLVEHRVKPGAKRSRDNEAEQIRRADKIIHTFFENIPSYAVTAVSGTLARTDIYELSLRLQISTGMAKALPVLGKLYFKDSGGFVPLGASAHGLIKAHYDLTRDRMITDSDGSFVKEMSPEEEERATALTNRKLSMLYYALSELISNDKSGTDVVDRLYFDEQDRADIEEKFLSRIRRDDKELECTQLEILGITKYTVDSDIYDVVDKSQKTPYFRFTFGLDGAVTLDCLGCDGGRSLIEDGVIAFTAKDGTRFSITLTDEMYESQDETLAIDSELLRIIKEEGRFSSHHIRVGEIYCKKNPRMRGCTKLACRDRLIELPVGDGKALFCRSCPYPEIVWRDGDSVGYTPMMSFVSDGFKLTADKEEINECPSCKRFVRHLGKTGLCELCTKAHLPPSQDDPEAEALYAKYKNILPVSVRAFAAGSRKLCYEDSEMLVFYIGAGQYADGGRGKYFVFNKLLIGEEGIIKPPKRV